jgi:hypothetical protein
MNGDDLVDELRRLGYDVDLASWVTLDKEPLYLVNKILMTYDDALLLRKGETLENVQRRIKERKKQE